MNRSYPRNIKPDAICPFAYDCAAHNGMYIVAIAKLLRATFVPKPNAIIAHNVHSKRAKQLAIVGFIHDFVAVFKFPHKLPSFFALDHSATFVFHAHRAVVPEGYTHRVLLARGKGVIICAMASRRESPKWGPRGPGLATAFEEQIRKLGLTETNCITSEELRQWCEHNKNHCYIPEWLLKRWGISVEPHADSRA